VEQLRLSQSHGEPAFGSFATSAAALAASGDAAPKDSLARDVCSKCSWKGSIYGGWW